MRLLVYLQDEAIEGRPHIVRLVRVEADDCAKPNSSLDHERILAGFGLLGA